MRDADLGQDACLDTLDCQCGPCREHLAAWLAEQEETA